MTYCLPEQLRVLFNPRDPLEHAAPIEKRKLPPLNGIAALVEGNFEDPKVVDVPPGKPIETKDERKERKRKEKAERNEKQLEEVVAEWKPNENPEATGDAWKTLFVSRLSYDTTFATLKAEFEVYGPVTKISMVTDKQGKPRGYAFIEYEHERDMKSAYKKAAANMIDGRRVVVDVERGRTVKGWKPRRLGGGLGGRLGGKRKADLKKEAAAAAHASRFGHGGPTHNRYGGYGGGGGGDRGGGGGDRGGGGPDRYRDRAGGPGRDRFSGGGYGGGGRDRDSGGYRGGGDRGGGDRDRGRDSRGGDGDRRHGGHGGDRDRGDRDRHSSSRDRRDGGRDGGSRDRDRDHDRRSSRDDRRR